MVPFTAGITQYIDVYNRGVSQVVLSAFEVDKNDISL
jgi:hypothetical protein